MYAPLHLAGTTGLRRGELAETALRRPRGLVAAARIRVRWARTAVAIRSTVSTTSPLTGEEVAGARSARRDTWSCYAVAGGEASGVVDDVPHAFAERVAGQVEDLDGLVVRRGIAVDC